MTRRVFQYGLTTVEVAVMTAAITLLSVLGYATLQHMQKSVVQPAVVTQSPSKNTNPTSINTPLPTVPNPITSTTDLEAAMRTINQIDPTITMPARDELSLEQLENSL